ncbi:MAG: type II secretion system protein [Georgfuchsia sp.]
MNGRDFRQAGFTYIALLIAVAIISATLATVAEVTHTMVQRDREKELLFIGNQFRQALNHYYANNRRYPLSLEDLVLDDRNVGIKRHLRKIFFDPMTGKAEWGTLKMANDQIIGVYSLSEAEPLKKAGFQLTEAGLEGKEKYSEWVFTAAVSGVVNTMPNAASAGQPKAFSK